MFFGKTPLLEQSPHAIVTGLLNDAISKLKTTGTWNDPVVWIDEALRLMQHLKGEKPIELAQEAVKHLLIVAEGLASAHAIVGAETVATRVVDFRTLLPELDITAGLKGVLNAMCRELTCLDDLSDPECGARDILRRVFRLAKTVDGMRSTATASWCLTVITRLMLEDTSSEKLENLIAARKRSGLSSIHPTVVAMMEQTITIWPPWRVFEEASDCHEDYMNAVLATYPGSTHVADQLTKDNQDEYTQIVPTTTSISAKLTRTFQQQLMEILSKAPQYDAYFRFHARGIAKLALVGWVTEPVVFEALANRFSKLGINNAAMSLLRQSLKIRETSVGCSSPQLIDVLLAIGHIANKRRTGKGIREESKDFNRHFRRVWEILLQAFNERQEWVCDKLIEVASNCQVAELDNLCLRHAAEAAHWCWQGGLKNDCAVPLLTSLIKMSQRMKCGEYAVGLVSIVGLGNVRQDVDLSLLNEIAKQHFEAHVYWVAEKIWEYLLSVQPVPAAWYKRWYTATVPLHSYELDYGEMQRRLPFCRQ